MILAKLKAQNGKLTSVEFDEKDLPSLARAGRVDAFIVATEDGFSPLGANRGFLSRDLGVPDSEIGELANWNRFDNPRVSLVALRSRRTDSLLRGVILAPSESSDCYKHFARLGFGLPYRDFYYNVTYEAIALACSVWGARRLAISHLSASGRFHEDIATCNAEALAHYCDAVPSAEVLSFMFIGCCIALEHLTNISRLNAEATTGSHRPIVLEKEQRDGYDLVHLAWGHKT